MDARQADRQDRVVGQHNPVRIMLLRCNLFNVVDELFQGCGWPSLKVCEDQDVQYELSFSFRSELIKNFVLHVPFVKELFR